MIRLFTPGTQAGRRPIVPNLGDEVIERGILDHLASLGISTQTIEFVSLQSRPSTSQLEHWKGTPKTNLVGGSNALGWSYLPHTKGSAWKPPPGRTSMSFVLCGVGWSVHGKRLNLLTKRRVKRMLSPRDVHSVRDEYTESLLKQLNVTNVLYTACPSLWSIDQGTIEAIPRQRSDAVITCVTDYARDPARDQQMLRLLHELYGDVVAFPQGIGDERYLRALGFRGRILSRDLDLFIKEARAQFGSVDYVGTRLHGGIWSLRHGLRSIIVNVGDGRSRELGRSVGLPTIEPGHDLLREAIVGNLHIDFRLPGESIRRWSDAMVSRLRHAGSGD